MMNLKLPTDVLNIIKTIEDAGYEAWCVGGSVRDMLRSHIPDDYDIASSTPCEIIENLFEKTIPTGIKHGTITVVINHKPYEITRYRIDGEYSDNRHPLSVNYTANFKEDLARRDFTINAIGFHPERKIFDPFGGYDDIKSKTIKAVGIPDKRFKEDALRILRGIRFAATLDFSIEENTLSSIKNNAHLLKNISAERIMVELKKTLMGINPALLSIIIENGGLEEYDFKGEDSLNKLNLLPNDYKLRFATLCYLLKADEQKAAKLLKFSNVEIKEIVEFAKIIKNEVSLPIIKRSLDILSYEQIHMCLDAVEILKDKDFRVIKEALIISQKENHPYKISMLKIGGNDIKALGFLGEKIGKVQNKLLDLVLENPNLNNKESLLEIAKKL